MSPDLTEHGDVRCGRSVPDAWRAKRLFLLFCSDLSGFLPPLLQLAASPVHSVRTMAAKALVATANPSEHRALLLQLTAQLPPQPAHCRHNRLHGQLLQTQALLDAALSSGRYAPMRRAGPDMGSDILIIWLFQ